MAVLGLVHSVTIDCLTAEYSLRAGKSPGVGAQQIESGQIYTSWVILMAAPLIRGVASCPIPPIPPFASCSVRIVDKQMTVAASTAEVAELPISRLFRYRQPLTPTSCGRFRAIGSGRARSTCTEPAPRRRANAPGTADQLTGGRRGLVRWCLAARRQTSQGGRQRRP